MFHIVIRLPAWRSTMTQRIVNYGFTIALGLALVVLPAAIIAADDTKTPDKEPPAKAPDFSKYKLVKVLESVEVVKADDKKVTVKISYTVFKPNPNPKLPGTNVPMKKDVDYSFLPESLVRTKVLPPKTDDNGKKVEYTVKEKAALKVPKDVVGYTANVSDLVAGSTVDIILVRDKSIPDAKATDDDLRIKYAIITALPTTPAPKKN
jgi:hypothetical protein